MELDAQAVRHGCRGGLNMAPTNKVHHVRTIARVAEMLGEDEDWLWDVANEMDQEDGLIWVYGPGDDGVMAFTDVAKLSRTGSCLRMRSRYIRVSLTEVSWPPATQADKYPAGAKTTSSSLDGKGGAT